MIAAPLRLARGDYAIMWLCVLLETDLGAALAMLDERRQIIPAADPQDTNAYVLGRISEHKVVRLGD